MNHLGLFEGIGGFSLAARWAGWHTVAWCEINPFCQTVLKYHFPNAKQHDDIKSTDFSIYREQIDIITGGFPCQPYSQAGRKLGKEDERHLWPQMLRAIQEIKPRWIVGENVPGLIGWSGGVVFEEIHIDLELAGYEVIAFVLPAASINAPHKRERVWFVACAKDYTNSLGTDFTDTLRTGREGGVYTQACAPSDSFAIKRNSSGYEPRGWQDVISEPPVCRGNYGLSGGLDGITFPKWRTESLKAYGNAIVSAVALQIFTAINQYENLVKTAQ
jgi:DNA (cytosine-5)-methyltransferase 1